MSADWEGAAVGEQRDSRVVQELGFVDSGRAHIRAA
jgi:hypothetical protein